MDTKQRNFIQENGLFLAFAIALISISGSLYFSEILGYIPCKLCWFQRVTMYPLTIILGIAAVKKDFRQIYYVLPFAVIGMILGIYHYSIQKGFISTDDTFCGRVPCTGQYINWFGFLTIPLLSLMAHTLIFIICLLLHKNRGDNK
ncbi:disulfide oxidoreductase [Niallia taxi]|uniref:disulfide oxidoreductase n=1 Tax=Niallia taxi TaxID=2499688 RepID=UPI0015F54F47|nr:disulfide oxidoreductase [Niallia taxi]